MTSELMPRLRDALVAADYTYAAIAEVLGPEAHAALSRNETTPGMRATTGGTDLETLTRLWLLQAAVPAKAVERALPGLLDELCAAGVLTRAGSDVEAILDLRPYADDDHDFFVLSDLTPGLDGLAQRINAEYVLGISPASTSLAQLTVRRNVASALDLGTGCGVQALHLARHAGRVVATDVNQRALWLTRLNAELNDVEIDIREGSFYAPVAGQAFDLIATNPPFVISPATDKSLVYRDSGLPGDSVIEQVVRNAPAHLNDGGICQVLANWMVLRSQPWEDRVAEWAPTSDLWVVQRELVDLPSYVELWLKDAGHHPATGGDVIDYRRRYDAWLSWLEQQGAEAIGFGWINLRKTDGDPKHRLEDWPYDVEQPIGPEIGSHFDRVEWLRVTNDAELKNVHARLRADVRQEMVGAPGEEDPEQILVRQQLGMRRGRQLTSGEAALLGACDGELPLGALTAAVAELTGETISHTTLRELFEEGWLTV